MGGQSGPRVDAALTTHNEALGTLLRDELARRSPYNASSFVWVPKQFGSVTCPSDLHV
jgi:hypothetical protein